MQPDLLASLRHLSDAELVARVQDLAAGERGATVLLVAHLAELDTRDVHFRAGHGSLFAYCRDVLALSEQEAYNRIAVGRAARRFPVILDLLEGGEVNLTTVRLLAPHLTPANHQGVLESARGKTKVQVEEIAAALWPRPDVPSLVRKLPAAKPPAPPPLGSVAGSPFPQTAWPRAAISLCLPRLLGHRGLRRLRARRLIWPLRARRAARRLPVRPPRPVLLWLVAANLHPAPGRTRPRAPFPLFPCLRQAAQPR